VSVLDTSFEIPIVEQTFDGAEPIPLGDPVSLSVSSGTPLPEGNHFSASLGQNYPASSGQRVTGRRGRRNQQQQQPQEHEISMEYSYREKMELNAAAGSPAAATGPYKTQLGNQSMI